MSGIGDKRARNERRRFFIQGFLSCCYKGLSLPCPYASNPSFAYIIENESVPVRP